MSYEECGLKYHARPATQILYTKNLTLTSDEEEEEQNTSQEKSRSNYKTRLKARRPKKPHNRGFTSPNRQRQAETSFNEETHQHDDGILEIDTSEEPLRSLNLPLYMSKPTQMYYNTCDIDESQRHSTVGYSLNYEDSDKSLLSKQEDALSIVEEEDEPDEMKENDDAPVESVENEKSADEIDFIVSNDKENKSQFEESARVEESNGFRESRKSWVDSECQTEESESPQAAQTSKTTSCGDLGPNDPADSLSGDASFQIPESSSKSHGAEEINENHVIFTSPKSSINGQNESFRKGDVNNRQPIVTISREVNILRAKSLEEKKIQLRKIFRETSQTAAIFHKASEHSQNNRPMADRAQNISSQPSRPQSRKPHLSPVTGRASSSVRSQSKSPSPPPSPRLRERRNASPRTQLTLQKCDPVITPKAEVIKTTIEEQLKRTSPTRGSITRPKSPSFPRGHPLGQGLTLDEFRGLRKGNQIGVSCKK